MLAVVLCFNKVIHRLELSLAYPTYIYYLHTISAMYISYYITAYITTHHITSHQRQTNHVKTPTMPQSSAPQIRSSALVHHPSSSIISYPTSCPLLTSYIYPLRLLRPFSTTPKPSPQSQSQSAPPSRASTHPLAS